MITNLLTGLSRENALQGSKISTFLPGQMINGKIIKLFPNGIASLQVGTQKIVAQLEASLDVQHRYWLQVQPGNGKVKLKVIGKVPSGSHQMHDDTSILHLMDTLSISNKDTKLETVKYLLKEQLPINKEIIEKSAEWLKEINQQRGLEAIKVILQKQLPLTKETFHAMLSVISEDSLTTSIENLGLAIQKEPLSHTLTKINTLLEELIDSTRQMERTITKSETWEKHSITPHSSAILLPEILTKLIHRIGFNYENGMLQSFQNNHENVDKGFILKPLLIELLNESPSEAIRTAAERVLNQITGTQLLSHETGPMQQQVAQIPLFLQGQNLDLTIQWNGRRSNHQEIDPDYCRVIFYLELANLGDTFIDMHVQNRIISITVINENENLKTIAKPLIPLLKEQLNSIHYTLSTVHFDPLINRNKKQSNPLYDTSSYSGVDIRI